MDAELRVKCAILRGLQLSIYGLVLFMGACGRSMGTASAQDSITVTVAGDLQAGLRERPLTGRLIVYFITESDRRWSMRQPLRGPWFDKPQPIASMSIEKWDTSQPIVLSDSNAARFGGPLDAFAGPVRVQALLHVNDDLPRLIAGPECLYSDVVSYEADANGIDLVAIEFNHRFEDVPPADMPANLKWIEQRSDLLSEALGRNVMQRCAVALPADYDERPDVRWPVVFVIPDRTDLVLRAAIEHAEMLLIPGVEDIAPNAVHVVLDPQTRWGHHGFVDSAFHGPRLTALVMELLPQLQRQFRLRNEAESRIVTGIGLGGWSALWLILNQPDVFGACWATAPTPVDFHALQNIDLYESANAFHDDSSEPYWAFRRTGMAIDVMVPATTSRQMWQMEQAIDTHGRSGGLWQTLHQMYGPVDELTGQVRPLFDSHTGVFDDAVRQHWQQFDIVALVRSNPEKYLPIIAERVHLFCGDLDSFYFDLAVRRFIDALQELGDGGPVAASSILLIEGAIHNNAQRHVFDDWNREMREHLRLYNLDVQ